MVTLSQQDIILELKQPNIEAAVKKLYDNYFDGIVAHVCVNGGSKDDGADIFQDAVLTLIEKVKTGQFRGDSSIKTFLSAIARNNWLHELRTRKRRNKRENAYMALEEKLEEPLQPELNKNDANILYNLLEQIGNPCKRILTGFYYEEKSMKDLLTEFNYENEQVLRNRKSRCMKKLKEKLTTNNLLQTLNPFSLYER